MRKQESQEGKEGKDWLLEIFNFINLHEPTEREVGTQTEEAHVSWTVAELHERVKVYAYSKQRVQYITVHQLQLRTMAIVP
jgi:hypothetical protein